MIQYVCDACGKAYYKPYKLGEDMSYDVYQNGTVISHWSGDLCKECYDKVDYEMNRAALRTIGGIEINKIIGNNAAQEGSA